MVDNEVFKLLNNKLDNVTEELVAMKASISNIESNTEITMINGGGMEVTMKTNVLMKNLFEQTKPGGLIDEKFAACKLNHTPQKKFGDFNKKYGTFLESAKIIGGFLIILLVVINFYVNSHNVANRDVKLNDIEKKIELLEKITK